MKPTSKLLWMCAYFRVHCRQEVPLLVVELGNLLGSSVADHYHQRVGHRDGPVQVQGGQGVGWDQVLHEVDGGGVGCYCYEGRKSNLYCKQMVLFRNS